MPNSDFKDLLKKYHQGQCSDEEQNLLFEWMGSKSNASELEETMMELWDQTESASPLGFDKEAIFDGIEKSINVNHKTQVSKRRFYVRILSVAATVALILISSIWMIMHFDDSNHQNEFLATSIREFKTDKGQFRTVSLPDGTVVKLNTSSSLKIGQTYSSDEERIVYLEGEAYFDVHRNEHKPFKVITKDVEVRVLGTSFNVNSSFNNQAVKVAVASGKVKVERVDKSNQVFLEKNQMVTIADNQFLKLTGFDPMKEFGWVERLLIFDQADFDQVVLQLENWYGVEIKISGLPEKNGQWNYTAVFENQSLDNVLLSMGFVKKFDYQIEEKEVKLSFK